MTHAKRKSLLAKGLNINEATLLGFLIQQQTVNDKDPEGYFYLTMKGIRKALSYSNKQVYKALHGLIQHDYIGVKFQMRTQRYFFKVYSDQFNNK